MTRFTLNVLLKEHRFQAKFIAQVLYFFPLLIIHYFTFSLFTLVFSQGPLVSAELFT